MEQRNETFPIRIMEVAPVSNASPNLHCTFCSLSGSHVLENCFKFKEASQEAQNKTKVKKKGKGSCS
jgi:hypothetical protein